MNLHLHRPSLQTAKADSWQSIEMKFLEWNLSIRMSWRALEWNAILPR